MGLEMGWGERISCLVFVVLVGWFLIDLYRGVVFCVMVHLMIFCFYRILLSFIAGVIVNLGGFKNIYSFHLTEISSFLQYCIFVLT